MTIGPARPRQRPLTVDDLARMPDDGRRYELVNGRLDVSPAPMRSNGPTSPGHRCWQSK